MFIALTIVFLTFVLIDLFPLRKAKQVTKIMILYFLLFGIGLSISFIQIFKLDIPSPADVLGSMIRLMLGQKE